MFDHDEDFQLKIVDLSMAIRKGSMISNIDKEARNIAPELKFGSNFDERCDVWSLGVMAHDMLWT